MPQEENITIPRWFLERIEDTLRIQNNINLDKKTGETCQDRNVKESLNGVRKLLRGKELTGGERLERLQPSLILSGDGQQEVDLEKEIEWEWVHREKQEVDLIECAEMDREEFARFARHFAKWGAEHLKK